MAAITDHKRDGHVLFGFINDNRVRLFAATPRGVNDEGPIVVLNPRGMPEFRLWMWSLRVKRAIWSVHSSPSDMALGEVEVEGDDVRSGGAGLLRCPHASRVAREWDRRRERYFA